MMQYRRVGKTDIRLSVIGFGTAQFQMLPERQAIETLRRGFELGVNWVHTSPDYGGVEHWIAKAIKESKKEIMVLAQGPGDMTLFGPFFENACLWFGKRRLELYGINCINDIEYMGQNVWGAGGMVEFLLKKKDDGRLGGIYCTTHGPPKYISKLIMSGVFDAIILAYNPLGFHQLTYFPEPLGREFENLVENREKIFPLAVQQGVSLIIMKALAGGLLCRGKAFPPHEWFPHLDKEIAAGDLLRWTLNLPGVCAVLPGTASVEEAEENALAGHGPLKISDSLDESITRTAQKMRSFLCSRCGLCESTCSKSLAISSMIRDAYIWIYRNETFMADERENYFLLNPSGSSVCRMCSDRTCRCPQGLDIPSYLAQIHQRMEILRKQEFRPGTPREEWEKYVDGHHQLVILGKDIPSKIKSGKIACCRFLIKNVGEMMWTAFSHIPDDKMAVCIGVFMNKKLIKKIPIRQNVCPNMRSNLVFEFKVPRGGPGINRIDLYLMSLAAANPGKDATLFYSDDLAIENRWSEDFQLYLRIRSKMEGIMKSYVVIIPKFLKKTKLFVYSKAKMFVRMSKRKSKFFMAGATAVPADAPEAVVSYGVRFIETMIPVRLQPAMTYGAWIKLENTGKFVWRSSPENGNPVDIFVLIDNKIFSILKLPKAEVKTGEEISIHFAFKAPIEAGRHELKVELVEENVAWFSHAGVPPFVVNIDVEKNILTKSTQVLDVALKHNIWYYLPTSGIQTSRDGRSYPLFVSHAKGCRLWDLEGREYIDYTMSWGSVILGYADDRVQNAIKEMLNTASLPPFPHPVEMEVSKMLAEDFPCAQMVVFGKNGSDVCTIAARMARLMTGKKMILSCGFHGWQDFGLDYFNFEACGIPDRPERCLYKFKFNDKTDFFKYYYRHKNDLAAVMIEPSGPFGGEYIGMEPDADKDFLETIAEAAREVNALLIFDEIITCYRYPKGSVQKATGVVPDLACLGKGLASGMPLAALVGSSNIFFSTFHKTHYCPTFKGEIYSFAAAKAAIQIYRSEPVAEHIWKYGEDLRRGINSICNQLGINAECKGPPFRMALKFNDQNPENLQLKRTLYVQELLKEGITTTSGVMMPSYAHDGVALEKTLGGVEKALDVIAKAEHKNDLHRYVEIPLL